MALVVLVLDPRPLKRPNASLSGASVIPTLFLTLKKGQIPWMVSVLNVHCARSKRLIKGANISQHGAGLLSSRLMAVDLPHISVL